MVTQERPPSSRTKLFRFLARSTKTQVGQPAPNSTPVGDASDNVCPGLSHVPKSFKVAMESPRKPNPILSRATVVPDRLRCRLSLGIDSETYHHKELFDLHWQHKGQVKACQDIGEKYIQKTGEHARTYYLVSQRYSIMEQVPPNDGRKTSQQLQSLKHKLPNQYRDAVRSTTAEGQGYRDKELFTQVIAATGAWEEDFPLHVVKHLIADKTAVIYLQITLCYQSFITRKPCNLRSCKCVDEIGGDKGILYRHKIRGYDFQKWFLSGKFLNEFFHRDLIQHLVRKDKDLQGDPGWKRKSRAEQEDFISSVQQFMVRILATCIYLKVSLLHVLQLADAGKRDVEIPISEKSLPFEWDEETKEDFYQNQFRFKAHMFRKLKNSSQIPEVSEDVFMPFLHRDFIDSGGFGDVYRVEIHELHHALTDDGNQEFAMKVIKKQDDGEYYFKKEIEVCHQLSRNPHKHITPLITAWQDKNNFYMLFPKARLDLHKFLLKPHAATKSRSIEWLLQQMRGLAKALEYIHTPPFTVKNAKGQEEGESSRGINKRQRVGRHRDLKPKNIFVFSEDDVLKIGDFGLAVIRERLSRNRVGPNSPKSKPENGDWDYAAPENDNDGSASGRGDVWSLGCVYMEMLLWFFGHEDDISKFREDRLREVIGSDTIQDGSFWCTGPRRNAVLRRAVESRFAWLREQASNKHVLKDLVGLVEQDIMIPHTPEKRFSAPQICSELKGLLQRAKDDLDSSSDFYDDDSKGKGKLAPGAPSSTGMRTTVGDDDDLGQSATNDSVAITAENGTLPSPRPPEVSSVIFSMGSQFPTEPLVKEEVVEIKK